MENIGFGNLKAIYINCTLKKSPELSHTDSLMEVSKQIMSKEKVITETIRALVVQEIFQI